jgi:4-carboxymuconolactone decarboxylase
MSELSARATSYERIECSGSSTVSQPRIPPQHPDDWDEYTRRALSTLSPPKVARPADEPDALARPRPVTNVTGILSRHPDLTKSFLVFNNHLFHSTLSDRIGEMATVRVSWLPGGEYEWAQHVRMAEAAGLTDAEISAMAC